MTEGTNTKNPETGRWEGTCGRCGQHGATYVTLDHPTVKWACRPCVQALYDATPLGQTDRARRGGAPYPWEK